MHRRCASPVLVAALLALATARCASSPPPVARDTFPLDPREGLSGPFDDAVERGWRALASGNGALAGHEFSLAGKGPSMHAGQIGSIEALVVEGRAVEALSRCATALEGGTLTASLLTACGEAEARSGNFVRAYALYERAVALLPALEGVASRALELRGEATEEVLAAADRDATEGRFEAARAAVATALAWSPRSPSVLLGAARVECAAGEKERALQYDREALALGGLDVHEREGAGDIAFEAGDYALAVSVFEALALEDPRFRERAAEARLAFRIANWPEPERQAARARRITRSAAAGIVWWMFPEVREAHVTAGLVAADALERRDSRPMTRAVALGLLDVDPDTHRARPDAPLTRAAAAQMMLNLARLLAGPGGGPACIPGSPGTRRGAADSIRLAARCGLLSESGGAFVSGDELTRGLDRLRSQLPTGRGEEP